MKERIWQWLSRLFARMAAYCYRRANRNVLTLSGAEPGMIVTIHHDTHDVLDVRAMKGEP